MIKQVFSASRNSYRQTQCWKEKTQTQCWSQTKTPPRKRSESVEKKERVGSSTENLCICSFSEIDLLSWKVRKRSSIPFNKNVKLSLENVQNRGFFSCPEKRRPSPLHPSNCWWCVSEQKMRNCGRQRKRPLKFCIVGLSQQFPTRRDVVFWQKNFRSKPAAPPMVDEKTRNSSVIRNSWTWRLYATHIGRCRLSVRAECPEIGKISGFSSQFLNPNLTDFVSKLYTK